jgi:DNA polymerase-3 subunit beta
MKVIVKKSVLLNALSSSVGIVDRKHTLPVLGHVLLKAEGASLGVYATDLDLSLVDHIEVDVQEAGMVAAPVHMLHEIVRKVPDLPIHLTYKQGEPQLLIECGSAKFQLVCLPSEDFPMIAQGADYPVRFSIEASALEYLISHTKSAISLDESRYSLNGICFHSFLENGVTYLRAAATDSHRLACAKISMPTSGEGMSSIIIARKTVLELLKFLESHQGPISVSVSAFQICFSSDNDFLSSRLVDAIFPEYEEHIPYSNEYNLCVEKQSFLDAIDRVTLMSSDKMRPVLLRIKEGSLFVSVAQSEMGSAEESLEVQYDGPETRIGFNGRYLLDLADVKSDVMTLHLKDADSAILVSNAGDENSLVVLMPMRV